MTVKIGVTALGLPALYLDNGKRVTTHSMLKSYLRCPKQSQYKYAERLKPRMITRRDQPLKRGTWLHECLEWHYSGRDWKEIHAKNTAKFNQLFDEERDALGDLPTEIAALMRSYFWHYGADKTDPMHGWEILGTEITLEAVWPDSEDGNDIYRCRLDFLARDEFGLIVGDHKSHKQLPDHTVRTLDAASPLYIWAARENGYDVRGFLWNYIKTKAPTKPELAYAGTARERMSKKAIDTDYVTYASTVQKILPNWREHPEVVAKLRSLKGQRWQHGAPQTSSFFRREILEKDDEIVAKAVARAMRTRDRMHGDFTDFDIVELSSDRSCSWCTFRELCTTEMYGGMGDHIRRKQFRVGDPLDYYQDQKDRKEND